MAKLYIRAKGANWRRFEEGQIGNQCFSACVSQKNYFCLSAAKDAIFHRGEGVLPKQKPVISPSIMEHLSPQIHLQNFNGLLVIFSNRNNVLSIDIFALYLHKNIEKATKFESQECCFWECADHVYGFCDFWRNSVVVRTRAAARTMFHVFCSTLFDNEMRYCSFVGLFTCSTLVPFLALRRCFFAWNATSKLELSFRRIYAREFSSRDSNLSDSAGGGA